MICPFCKRKGEALVKQTRPCGQGVRRRYHCACGGRFSTVESVIFDGTTVDPKEPRETRNVGP